MSSAAAGRAGDDPLDGLYAVLGYRFEDPSLLWTALTHRSFVLPPHGTGTDPSNERLEFLGDSVLGLVISAELLDRFPDKTDGGISEGPLTIIKAKLVKNEHLAAIATSLGLQHYVLLGTNERNSRIHESPKCLADTLEAVFGAIFTDAGYEEARRVIARLYKPILDGLVIGPASSKPPKSRLLEWFQARKQPLPTFVTVESSGPDHMKTFVVECRTVDPEFVSRGEGRTVRAAEEAAAQNFFDAHLMLD